MSINSNIGVTSITLNSSDQHIDSAFIANSRKYTKLCATFYNPGDQRDNFQDPDIISFPSDFFTLIKYDLVVRSTATNQNTTPSSDVFFYTQAKVLSGGYIVDGTQNAILSPNISDNTLGNLTIGDIELPTVQFLNASPNPVEGESTLVSVVIGYSNGRYTLSLKNLQIKEKATIFLELF